MNLKKKHTDCRYKIIHIRSGVLTGTKPVPWMAQWSDKESSWVARQRPPTSIVAGARKKNILHKLHNFERNKKEIRNCPKNEDVTERRKCTKQQKKTRCKTTNQVEGMSELGRCDIWDLLSICMCVRDTYYAEHSWVLGGGGSGWGPTL